MPAPKGYSGSLSGMAAIPGTTSAWAAGEADANKGSGTVGVITKYGR